MGDRIANKQIKNERKIMWIILTIGVIGFISLLIVLRSGPHKKEEHRVTPLLAGISIVVLTFTAHDLAQNKGMPMKASDYKYSKLSPGIKYRVIGKVDHFILITDDMSGKEANPQVWVIKQWPDFINGNFASNSCCAIVDGDLRNVYINYQTN